MAASANVVLEAGRVQAEMSFGELWIAYFALGGSSTLASVRSFLRGDLPIGLTDYDVLAHAINERFVERGGNHPVPYREDLSP